MPPDSDSTGIIGSERKAFFLLPDRLLGRLYLLAALGTMECLVCMPLGQAWPFGHVWLRRIGIVSFAAFLAIAYSRLKTFQHEIPFGRVLFLAHIVCVSVTGLSTLSLLLGLDWQFLEHHDYALIATYLLGTLLLALACVPLGTWIEVIKATRFASLYAILAGVAASLGEAPLWKAWDAYGGFLGGFLQRSTFLGTSTLLQFFSVPGIVSDPSTATIGTPTFSVQIADACSGIEGLGLTLAFTSVWLWYRRKQIRFPQSLLLIPAAMVCIYVLNFVRIAVLILIGTYVSPDVAIIGFHTLAGWIAFTLVAVGFTLATQNLSWVLKTPTPVSLNASLLAPSLASSLAGPAAPASLGTGADAYSRSYDAPGESPAIRAYVIPFLAILAASFISRMASADFEWLYPLRFVAGAAAIWYFRKELAKLDWRCGWMAPATGAAVFAVWVAPAWLHPAASALGAELAALPLAARITWLAFRVTAAVVTVPVAEELAFRGFLARRLVNKNFDEVPFFRLTIIPVAVSSLAFGLMHGHDWIAGTIAGLAYALLLRWRGRMGDAVVAHATSNLLLAAWVLCRGDWAQW